MNIDFTSACLVCTDVLYYKTDVFLSIHPDIYLVNIIKKTGSSSLCHCSLLHVPSCRENFTRLLVRIKCGLPCICKSSVTSLGRRIKALSHDVKSRLIVRNMHYAIDLLYL